MSEDVGWLTTNTLREKVALHRLRLDMPFHLRHKPGQLIERIDGDVAVLSGFLSQLLISALQSQLMSHEFRALWQDDATSRAG